MKATAWEIIPAVAFYFIGTDIKKIKYWNEYAKWYYLPYVYHSFEEAVEHWQFKFGRSLTLGKKKKLMETIVTQKTIDFEKTNLQTSKCFTRLEIRVLNKEI